MDHPSDEVLARVAEGEVRSEGELAEHLRSCRTCTEVLSGLLRARTGTGLDDTARSTRSSDGAPKVHQTIGRYRVERLLGEGAMGQVFEALDPELNRRVAVKVVRGTSSAELRARLLREAQTAARVRHRNIVTVHDAGTIDEEVFIAMELVPGGSVRSWLSTPRSWREVVRVFVGAGKGLAEVHDAGLVHRDFKPDNVLLDTDGTARVSDFGLVGAEPGAALPQDAKPQLTQTGVMMGTPAYMSPELFAGASATPGSDQFAFCVALFEALAGERPFRASTVAELRQVVQAGATLPLPSHLPGWLVKAVRRGLSVDSTRRFGSMHELVDLMEAAPAQRSRRTLVAFASLTAVALVGVSAFVASTSDARRCRQGASRIDAVWTPERRAALNAHVTAIPSPYASDTVRVVDEAFDRFARDWREMHVEACEATRVRGEQSDQLLDLRVQCLEARLTGFAAAIHSIEQLTNDELENAPRVVQVGGLAACADTKSLANTTPPPASSDDQAKVVAIRAALADVTAQTDLGRAKLVLTAAGQAVTDARTLGWRPLEAEALLALGTAQERTAAPAAAQTLADAALAAEAGRSDPTLVAALGTMATQKTDNAPKQARELIRRARAVLERLADPDMTARIDLTEASLFVVEATPEKALALMDALVVRRGKRGDHIDLVAQERRGQALNALGRLKEALAAYEAVCAGREALDGRQHPLSLVALKNVAAMKDALSDYEGARAVLTDVLVRSKENFGEVHPTVARALVNLANSWFHQGRSTEAIPLYEKALALFEQLSPEPSMPKAMTIGNLSSALSDVGRKDEAMALQQKSIDMLEKVLGPEHPEYAYALASFAGMQRSNKHLPEGIATLEKALAIQRKVLPKNHPDLGISLFLLADMRNVEGKPQVSRQLAQEALEIDRLTVGPEGNETGAVESFIAGLDLALGQAAQALPVFERVRQAYDATGNQSIESALNHLKLAQALVATRGPQTRVCAEAGLSKTQFAAAGVHEEEMAAVNKVLRENRCP